MNPLSGKTFKGDVSNSCYDTSPFYSPKVASKPAKTTSRSRCTDRKRTF